jgi:NAD(P)-dependent dehydrogenase (short-subunit alcohol dehydrogenase family)
VARTYVVTGSASGIGRSTGARLEAKGCRVIGVDRRDADVIADLSTPSGREAVLDGVLALTDTLDAVVACAGVAVPTPLSVRVNYFGAVASLQALRPLLARGDQPRAVVVVSLAAILPTHDELVAACLAGDEERAVGLAAELGASEERALIYASSKRALARWLRQTASTDEWAGSSIPLNGVAPGVIDTPMTAGVLADERIRESVERQVPMPLGGVGAPEAVAALLDWLSGAENVLTTGQIVFIDGGADAVLRGDTGW